MRTGHRPSVVILLGTWMVAAGAVTAAAQADAVPRAEVSVAAGTFLASDDAVKTVYRGTSVPVAVLGDVGLTRLVSVFAGGRFLHMTGHPVIAGSAAGAPDSDVDLSVRTVVFGGRVHFRRGRIDATAGAAAAYSTYTESWAGTSESVSGSAWGPILHGGVAIGLSRRFAAVGRIEWSRVATGQGSVGSPNVQLGGVDLLGGIAVRF
jgi:hypothetical protein